MSRGQKSFNHSNNGPLVTDDEIYMMVMLYTYQHKSIDYLSSKKEILCIEVKVTFQIKLVQHKKTF